MYGVQRNNKNWDTFLINDVTVSLHHIVKSFIDDLINVTIVGWKTDREQQNWS